ncbi:glycosyltransferase [Deinococcus aquaticus]|uniref:glycosyltransferase n=1 Tax=Deinococcus aquaticus TaxID=328692 RepID=UPI003F47C1FC
MIVVENMSVPADRRVWNEALALSNDGYNVSVISPCHGSDVEHEILEGVNIYRFKIRNSMKGKLQYIEEYLWALKGIRDKLRIIHKRMPIDVIQICNPPDILFLSVIPYKFSGVKIIFDHHDLAPEMAAEKFGNNRALKFLMLACEWMTFKISDKVISTNQSHKDIAIRRGGIKESDIEIVMSAPSIKNIPKRNRPDNICIGYMGIVGEQDGVEYYIYAVKTFIMLYGNEKASFKLIGDGPYMGEINKLINELELGSIIECTGFLKGEEYRSHMSQISIGVSPDTKNNYSDRCTMNKTLEYMAMGIPFVAFPLDETLKIAEGSGIFVEDRNYIAMALAIRKLIDDKLLSEKLGRLGREKFLSEINWENQKSKLISLYNGM